MFPRVGGRSSNPGVAGFGSKKKNVKSSRVINRCDAMTRAGPCSYGTAALHFLTRLRTTYEYGCTMREPHVVVIIVKGKVVCVDQLLRGATMEERYSMLFSIDCYIEWAKLL